MTSPSPLLYDTYYHIYNRGINRENIFLEERNYAYFLGLYDKYIAPVAETCAYCLLKNHFHVLVRVRSEEEIKILSASVSPSETRKIKDPSGQFSDFFNAYAKAINKTYQRTGSLFQHPFGRIPVTSDAQFCNVVCYIHLNPQKHTFVDDFREWKYSSYGTLLSEQPTHLDRSTVLAWFGTRKEYIELHNEWVRYGQLRWTVEDDIN